ncbi:MAG: CHASE3 domain-containing protein [Aphanocapsa sp. GSE-SYN-MK-11-07L]|jgi:PAS domain S-box-containing protein|nr:CHASE3 domain-containing protein [Aphanocapsa sp. GSE-SYN-MK-11-07L]
MKLSFFSWQTLKTCWQALPLEGRGSIAISIPLLCLIVSVVANTLLRQKIVQSQAYVSHTQKVLLNSHSALISLLDAETGVRGYYLTRQPEFLAPYKQSLTRLWPSLDRLQQLMRDNPTQANRVQRLAQIAQLRMAILQRRVQEVEKNTKNSQLLVPRLSEGKQVMDRFRLNLAQFEAEEYRLLDIRTRRLERQQDFNAWVMWCSVAISLLGTGLALNLLRLLARELRERELSLTESRNLIQAIVANVVDGVMVISPQGKIASFNSAAVTMFGYTPAEVIGWNWQQLLTKEAAASQKLLLNSSEMLVEATPIGRIWQAMGRRKNGDWFPIEISVSRIDLDDDRIAIIRDISDRLQTAAKLAARAEELAKLNTILIATNQSLAERNRELDQFAYVASHDLKAPLRAITSLSEWIEEDLAGQLPPQNQTQMTLLRGRVQRMQALLNGLLEYSRVGRSESPILAVNVASLLAEVVQILAPPPTFQIEITPDLPTFSTRRKLLKQVFIHLIDNAIRHHPTETGWAKVSVSDLGDRYEFAVSDNGEGIDPQFQTKIYTIFQTLKARDVQENTGIGLAIVKKIVEMEGGTIDLESALNLGAIFRFTWLKKPI